MEDYEKRENKINKRLETLGKEKGSSNVIKKLANKSEKDEDKDVDICIAQRVFEESLEEYREGDYTWKEFCKEIAKSLEQIK